MASLSQIMPQARLARLTVFAEFAIAGRSVLKYSGEAEQAVAADGGRIPALGVQWLSRARRC